MWKVAPLIFEVEQFTKKGETDLPDDLSEPISSSLIDTTWKKLGVATTIQWLDCWAFCLEPLLLRRVIVTHRNWWSFVGWYRHEKVGYRFDKSNFGGSAGEKGYRCPSQPAELCRMIQA